MKGAVVVLVVLVVTLVVVQIHAEDAETQTYCVDKFEQCSKSKHCCRGLFCRKSPYVDKKRCVKKNYSPSCAQTDDFCRRKRDCCGNGKCILGKCRRT